VQITPDECLDIGLGLAGFGRIRQWSEKTMLCCFQGHYETSPETCSSMFRDIQHVMIVEARIHNPDPMGFFIALTWLKSYKTEENMASTFRLAKKTIRTKVWRYVGAI
jgi:hypothetical protein